MFQYVDLDVALDSDDFNDGCACNYGNHRSSDAAFSVGTLHTTGRRYTTAIYVLGVSL